jgi:hypothetical protein
MPVISKKFIQKGTPKATPDVGYTGGLANLFFFLQGCRLGTIGFESCGVGMKGSVVNICSEKDRPLNSISLQNAVLCADCDVVSDSPHDHCLVCGSRSLLNISRLLGGTMPGRRTMLIENAGGPSTSPRPVLKFPKTRRVFNSRDRVKVQDALQQRLFR